MTSEPKAAISGEMMSVADERIVKGFFEAFDRLDLEAALTYTAEDCVHDDKPEGIHASKQAIRDFLSPQMRALKSRRAELTRLLSEGDIVMLERVDQVELKGGQKASLPAMSTIEITGGKISVWRDYYDKINFQNQLSAR